MGHINQKRSLSKSGEGGVDAQPEAGKAGDVRRSKESKEQRSNDGIGKTS